MVNLVNVTIHGDDASGPAFASVMSRGVALKKFLADVGRINLEYDTNKGQLAAKLAEINAMIASDRPKIDIGTIGRVPIAGPYQNISDKFQIQGLAVAQEQLAATREQTERLSKSFGRLEVSKDSLTRDVDQKLNPAINRSRVGFGLWGLMIRGTLGHIRLWHVALDAVLESAVALGSGLTALTIGIATMVPAAQDIYTHLQAVHTVNSALGSDIPPLTGKFEDLAKAMVPQTIEAYGGALNILNRNTGNLALVAHEVVTGIDDLVAKLDIWSSHQQSNGKILQNGVAFLHQFEQILGNVGQTIDHLVKADPGTAHFLLDIVVAVSKLLNVITSVPTPLLAAALGLHSLYLWGNVASGTLGRLIGLIPGLGRLSAILNRGFAPRMLLNPYVDAAILASAMVFELVKNWNRATDAANNYVSSVETDLTKLSASQQLIGITAQVGALNDKINHAFSADVSTRIDSFNSSLDKLASAPSWNSIYAAAKQITTVFFNPTGAMAAAAADISKYEAEIRKLVGAQSTLYQETGNLLRQGYSLAQAFGIMDLAGVQYNDSLELMQQKVKNLITGYQNMSVSGRLLSASVNAVTFASLQQDSKVSELNSAWDNFISTLAGGESAFASFAQQAQGMYDAMTIGNASLNESNGRVSSSIKGLGSAAKSAAVSMTGLDASSLNVRQAFLQSVTAANAQMDALTTLASAAGLGTKGTDLLTQANKDLIAILLPAARHSQALTDILYGLAQRGGYPGADSFKELAKWADNSKNPMKNLDSIVTTLTKDAGNLTQDVQNLSIALGTTLNDAMSQVIVTESGGLRPMEALYTAIKTTGLNSRTTANDSLALAKQFYTLTGNIRNAQGEFETFAIKALGLTKAQADALWQKTLPSLQASINSLHGKNVPIGITGTGFVIITGSDGKKYQISAGGYYSPHAAGGLIGGMGSPTADDKIIAASTGEYVVKASSVSKYGVGMMHAINSGRFAGGGLVGDLNSFPSRYYSKDYDLTGQASGNAASVALKAAIAVANATAKAASGFGGGVAGPGGGTPAANVALAQKILGWSGSQFGDLVRLWTRESGWNQYAYNASSGATGIPQALPYTKMPRAAWLPSQGGQANVMAQETWGGGYILGRYGNPSNAWAHELAYGWYDNGGWLRPGWTMAYNGTGRPEAVGGVGGVHITLELGQSFRQLGLTDSQLKDLRYTIRKLGGTGAGSVQAALGQN